MCSSTRPLEEGDIVNIDVTVFIGGHHGDTPASLRERAPERIIEFAVKGMIPRNRLGRKIFKKLKVYAGSEHPHQAQEPESCQIS